MNHDRCTNNKMRRRNMRAKYFQIALVILALLTANGNLFLSNRAARAQGLDLSGMDKSIDPGDDFFSYANAAG
jgi:hypothetical protein